MTRPVFRSTSRSESASYSLEIIARMSGMSAETIVHYQEQGLIPTAPADSEEDAYNDETLRTLRRIDHLRSTLEINEAGLRLILGLMEELDRLRNTPHGR